MFTILFLTFYQPIQKVNPSQGLEINIKIERKHYSNINTKSKMVWKIKITIYKRIEIIICDNP